jgi:hypothetical protein
MDSSWIIVDHTVIAATPLIGEPGRKIERRTSLGNVRGQRKNYVSGISSL